MTNTTKNPDHVRFWTTVHGSPVRLTLRDGDHPEHHQFERTDEGFWARSTSWCYDRDAGIVSREIFTKEQDCDGPLERYVEDFCPIGDLDRVLNDRFTQPVSVPMWRIVSRHQRDHFAEAARY